MIPIRHLNIGKEILNGKLNVVVIIVMVTDIFGSLTIPKILGNLDRKNTKGSQGAAP